MVSIPPGVVSLTAWYLSHPAWYPLRRGIYPTRRGIPYGVVSLRTAATPAAMCEPPLHGKRNRATTSVSLARSADFCCLEATAAVNWLQCVLPYLLRGAELSIVYTRLPSIPPTRTHTPPSPRLASLPFPSLPFPPSSYTRSLAFVLLSPTPTRRSLPLRAHRAAHIGAVQRSAVRAGRYNKNMAKVRQHRSVARRHKDKGANSSGGTCRTSKPSNPKTPKRLNP